MNTQSRDLSTRYSAKVVGTSKMVHRGNDPIIAVFDRGCRTPASYYATTLANSTSDESGGLYIDAGANWRLSVVETRALIEFAQDVLEETEAEALAAQEKGWKVEYDVKFQRGGGKIESRSVAVPADWDDEHIVRFLQDSISIMQGGTVVRIARVITFASGLIVEDVLPLGSLSGEPDDDVESSDPNDVYRLGGVQGAN